MTRARARALAIGLGLGLGATACGDDIPSVGLDGSSSETGATSSDTSTSTTSRGGTTTATTTSPGDTTTAVASTTDASTATSTTAATTSTGDEATETDGSDSSGDGPTVEPYGDCVNLPVRWCDGDLECVADIGPPATGVCVVSDCVDAGSCPPAPAGSNAVVACADITGDGTAECVLSCDPRQTCPPTMTCTGSICTHAEVSLSCADDTIGPAVPVSVFGTNQGMGDDFTPTCAAPMTSQDVAFQFTAPISTTYEMNTFGSTFDTILTVQTSCAGGIRACNDDALGLSSRVFVELVAGQTVLVVVDGHDALGDFALHIDIATGDGDCCTWDVGVAGCEVPVIENCVCGMDSYCCDVEWDDVCVDVATSSCQAICV